MADMSDNKQDQNNIQNNAEEEPDASAGSLEDVDAVKTEQSVVRDATVAVTTNLSHTVSVSVSDSKLNTMASGSTATVYTKLGPTKQVPLSSPLPSLVNSLRISAVTAMKRTRQTLTEKLGRGSKTVDAELEARIESLRIVQKRYADVMQLARSFSLHFTALITCQQSLAKEFSDLSQKIPELHNEFAYNAETQRALFRNGETLLGALNFFTSTLNTLCFKTIEDTLNTVTQYEDARLEYDAYRADFEASGNNALPSLQQSVQQHREKFEQQRQILDIKLKFVDENKVKVMHQQLLLFHNAIAAYFAGNQTALDDTIKQFSIKLKSPNSEMPSWLENQD